MSEAIEGLPVERLVGHCCYGGMKPKSACASCAAWRPTRENWITIEELTAKYRKDPERAAAMDRAREGLYALISKKLPNDGLSGGEPKAKPSRLNP